MSIIAVLLIIFAGGFAAVAFLYKFGSRGTCPRCRSRRTDAHLGVSYAGSFFSCRDCGAVFDGNGAMIDRNLP